MGTTEEQEAKEIQRKYQFIVYQLCLWRERDKERQSQREEEMKKSNPVVLFRITMAVVAT